MPVHQISVVPAMKETTLDGRGSGRTRDKSKECEVDKAPGRSGSRSSNISKASNSTQGFTLNGASRTSVTLSNQDICSHGVLVKFGKDGSDQTTATVSLNHASNSAPIAKRQVKRWRRRDRGRRGGVVRRAAMGMEQPERPLALVLSESSSEDEERWRQVRSWSNEKARRRQTHAQGGAEDQPITRQKEKWLPRGGGVTFRSSERSSTKREERESKAPNHRRGWGCGSGRSSEEQQPITRSQEAQGLGDQDMATLRTQKYTNTSVQNDTAQQAGTGDDQEVCRICHCEGDEECVLITPCRCTGSLRFVHQSCLNQWIKSSDTRCCELCKYEFVMEAHFKPLRKWEKLQMSSSERRKIFCSVTFHLVAVACVVWSLYILINRTAEEIQQGKNNGVLEWPFWTKLTVVALSFAGGLIFMYIQCKVYLQLWRRLKAFNRVIFVQNCPDSVCHVGEKAPPTPASEGIHETSVFQATQTQMGASCPAPPGSAEVASV